jgi:hypothetical protein
MCYGNLRGLKEAGRAFAVPTYFFSAAVLLMIVVGLARFAFGDLGSYDPHTITGAYSLGAGTDGIVSVVMVFTLLKAFANGGASLTGIEAVSDAVGAFHAPEGRNARQVLISEAVILGLLIAGISWLAFATHATPRISGYPTVLAQEAQIVFGHTVFGQILFYLLQLASMLILYTGGNTSFNGFPFLASYVAGDSFLPRWLLKRGHRLVFSNAIIVLTALSAVLIIIKDADVNSLVPLYAIGVFTAFTMAGFGMAKYHHTHQEPGWRRRLVINFSAGALSFIVVLIFAVVKFTEGAWIVVVLFVVLVPALIRLNSEYRAEAEVLDTVTGEQPPPAPQYTRRVVFVLVDSFDLATLAALRYARSLRPQQLSAVHFVIDSVVADKLREKWTRADRGVSLEFVDCPDRRLARAATELVEREAQDPGTHVTVVLPRRGYSPVFGRLLHDRTGDKIATAISRIPRSAATIIPYDVPSRVHVLQSRQAAKAAKAAAKGAGAATPTGSGTPAFTGAASNVRVLTDEAAVAEKHSGENERPGTTTPVPGAPAPDVPVIAAAPAGTGRTGVSVASRGIKPIGSVTAPGKVSVAGKVRVVEIRPVEQNSVLAVEVNDSTGNLTALFYGRSHIPGLICGASVRLTGSAGIKNGQAVMINPAYELIVADTGE